MVNAAHLIFAVRSLDLFETCKKADLIKLSLIDGVKLTKNGRFILFFGYS